MNIEIPSGEPISIPGLVTHSVRLPFSSILHVFTFELPSFPVINAKSFQVLIPYELLFSMLCVVHSDKAPVLLSTAQITISPPYESG
jgi:hypothetical protein